MRCPAARRIAPSPARKLWAGGAALSPRRRSDSPERLSLDRSCSRLRPAGALRPGESRLPARRSARRRKLYHPQQPGLFLPPKGRHPYGKTASGTSHAACAWRSDDRQQHCRYGCRIALFSRLRALRVPRGRRHLKALPNYVDPMDRKGSARFQRFGARRNGKRLPPAHLYLQKHLRLLHPKPRSSSGKIWLGG
jgi:hypothetical protein